MVPHSTPLGNVPPPQSGANVPIADGRASALAAPAVAAGVRRLLAAATPPWQAAGWTVLKERTVRTVAAGELDGIAVHLKVYRADRWLDRARDAWRGPRASREFANLDRLRRAGFPVVEPLAHGQLRIDDELRSFLVTRSIAGAVPFTLATAAAAHATAGALLRRLHDAGERPLDLHPGNLLVDTDRRLWLLDLANVANPGPASLADRAKALAQFCHEFPDRSLDGGALDPAARTLLAGYLDAGPDLGEAFRGELQLASHRWRASALASFGRRAFRSCRHTEVGPQRRGLVHWYWHQAPAGGPVPRAELEAFAPDRTTAHKSGRRGGVWVGETFVAKVRAAAAARRLWQAAYWLTFAGVPTAAPMALRTYRGEGIVFTRRVPGSNLAEELRRGALDEPAVRAAARSLGDSLGRLHAHGLRNRDLKFDNLVRDPATGIVHCVDLDGVGWNAVHDHRGSGADLGRLLAAFAAAGNPGGRATLRAFLRCYLLAQRRLLQSPPWRRILRHATRRAAEWRAAHAS
jgi:tRNA A-37 threonylcarbamoyl transferase component Bud32